MSDSFIYVLTFALVIPVNWPSKIDQLLAFVTHRADGLLAVLVSNWLTDVKLS